MSGTNFYRIERTIKKKTVLLSDRIISATGDITIDTTKTFIDSINNSHIEKLYNIDELKELITLHTCRLTTKDA
jgi:hypothetical protein